MLPYVYGIMCVSSEQFANMYCVCPYFFPTVHKKDYNHLLLLSIIAKLIGLPFSQLILGSFKIDYFQFSIIYVLSEQFIFKNGSTLLLLMNL